MLDPSPLVIFIKKKPLHSLPLSYSSSHSFLFLNFLRITIFLDLGNKANDFLMHSPLKSLSAMGISNSEMLLSEKDLKLKIHVRRPALEFEDKEQQEEAKESKSIKEGENCKLSVSSLKIKVPSLEEFKMSKEQEQDQDVNDGFKTPTSSEKKIPCVVQCPPAPRKPKSQPCAKRKPTPAAGRRVFLDLSNEIESLFAQSVVGAKMKKVRQQNESK